MAMPKYQFRLETLRKVRGARRDERRAALAEAYQAGALLDERQTELAAEQTELRALQRSAASGHLLDVNQLLEAQRYELVLRARGQEIANQRALLETETERRRQALVEADRDVRALDHLDDRHRREHQRQAQRAEQKQLDETAAQRHNRHLSRPA
jgi:flagellar export protein FliJ